MSKSPCLLACYRLASPFLFIMMRLLYLLVYLILIWFKYAMCLCSQLDRIYSHSFCQYLFLHTPTSSSHFEIVILNVLSISCERIFKTLFIMSVCEIVLSWPLMLFTSAFYCLGRDSNAFRLMHQHNFCLWC